MRKKRNDFLAKSRRSVASICEIWKIVAESVGKCGFCAFRSGLAEMCSGASLGPLCEKRRYRESRRDVPIMIRIDVADNFRFEFGGGIWQILDNKSLTFESGHFKPHFTARIGRHLSV